MLAHTNFIHNKKKHNNLQKQWVNIFKTFMYLNFYYITNQSPYKDSIITQNYDTFYDILVLWCKYAKLLH